MQFWSCETGTVLTYMLIMMVFTDKQSAIIAEIRVVAKQRKTNVEKKLVAYR